MQPSERHLLLTQLLADINRIILGKKEPVRMALACLLAGGHLLLLQ